MGGGCCCKAWSSFCRALSNSSSNNLICCNAILLSSIVSLRVCSNNAAVADDGGFVEGDEGADEVLSCWSSSLVNAVVVVDGSSPALMYERRSRRDADMGGTMGV